MVRLLILTFCLSTLSCGLFDGTDIPVSYIHFSDAKISTLPDQGASTENIKDLWIEIDGKDLGVNALPCTVPFVTENPNPIIYVNAGIRNNGVQGTAVTYPLFDVKELNPDFSPDQIDTMVLTFDYKDNAVFSLVEGFEGAHIFTKDEDDDPDSEMVSTDAEARNGQKSGLLRVDEENPAISVSTFLEFNSIPENGTPVYLELDYKNDATFVAGLVGVSEGGQEVRFDKIFIPARDEWNKIYIDFTDDIVEAGFEAYRVLFSLVLDQGATSNHVYLDNVKLIHF